MIFTIVYFTGFILALYPIYHLLLQHGATGPPYDVEDKFFAGMIGSFASLAWPLILIGSVAFLVSRKVWQTILSDDKDKVSA